MALARSCWHQRLARTRIDQLVFLDEFGCTTTMQRTHGRAPPNVRVISRVPGGHWKTVSTIAALTTTGITVSASFEGATDTDAFVAFVEQALIPTLRQGDVVVLDNLSCHKSPRVRQCIEGAGAQLMHLPPYSPDLNPIEMAIAKVKGVLKTLAPRDIQGVLAGLDLALPTIRPGDSIGYYSHCGYHDTMTRKGL